VILVDSSVWIDYFNGVATLQTNHLDDLLGSELLAVGDLILAEVLQGFGSDREFNGALRLMRALELVPLGGLAVAIEAAKNYRKLRDRGITVRKTIDTVIATRCILDGLELLHSDRDFDAFERYLGLQCVVCPA